jgi:hypothetical protein
MGAFAQRPSTYTPPLDGSEPGPTLVGGGADAPPTAAPGQWRIELRRHPILHRGHAVLALVDPTGETVAELNGMAKSRNADTDNPDKTVPIGVDGSRLVVTERIHFPNARRVGIVATGSYDDIVNGQWARGVDAARRITAKNYDYKGHDPAYEFGGSGGEIQNSNSVAYTLGRAMDLDLDAALNRSGTQRRFSGWGRDLLDPNYKRYVAPPQFAVSDTP